MPATISTRIHPLYQELIKIHLEDFLPDNDFMRLCNKHGWDGIFVEAQQEELNERSAKEGTWDFLIPGDKSDYQDQLARFLNKLFIKEVSTFPSNMVILLCEYLKWTHRFVVIDKIIADLKSLGLSGTGEEQLRNSWQRMDQDISRKIALIKTELIGQATNGNSDNTMYELLRKSLMGNVAIVEDLPEEIKKFRTLGEFWPSIRDKFGSYRERRQYLNEQFEKIEQKLERNNFFIPQSIEINEQYIKAEWSKAHTRLTSDPEAAITSARTLVETVCKHILDNKQINYDDGADLPALYKLTAQQLNLSPEQHTEQIFKQILSGCTSIVTGLGSLRNKLGDAHGKSMLRVKPAPRHALLAVNMAGSMTQFLLETFESSLIPTSTTE